MSDAQAYYNSLLQQGYNTDQAKVYTQEHYPGFMPTPAAPSFSPAQPQPVQQSQSVDPMMAMMMMNQQNQQMMMQQQALLAQSQQNSQSGPIIINNQQQQAGVMYVQNRGKDTLTGYLLWCSCFILLCGIHRFYYNRPFSGLIYLFTFGLFGFGQLYDLLVMPELARSA
ncbi:MAG: TM2 domain-containing protein [archaeon]|nr:TM2 domain-containing protein [archaeon]MDA0842730.1 TM2 domain-containing protein [archaeon]